MMDKNDYHRAYFERGTRYYYFVLEKDLLGDWVITRVNGSLGKRLGQVRYLAQPSYESGAACFIAMTKQRVKRNYHRVTLC